MLCTALAATGLMSMGGSIENRVAVAAEAETEAAEETAEGGLKLGLAISADVSGSADAGEENGAGAADLMIAAVTVDAEGKVVSCAIDSVQAKVEFDAEGKLVTDATAEIPSKQELGEAYGMKAASSIGKEWNEQADGFAAYCVGKTADEINGIAVTEDGKAEDADLAASCTVYFGGFQAIVTKAMENAAESGVQAGDKLGLGISASVADSKEATAEEDGAVKSSTTVSAAAVDAEGKITGAVIDAVQTSVNFDAAGKVTSDLTAAIQTKNELGEGYGMKAASTIGKEWKEQAAAYASYAVGKTAEEVNGTAVTEGVPSDADLAASVTVHIGEFNAVLTKAVNNAK